MKLKLKDTQSINFRNTSIRSIQEDHGHLCFSIDKVVIEPPIKTFWAKNWMARDCTFVCKSLNKNQIERWINGTIQSETYLHECPITDLINVERKNNCLVLSGFSSDRNWVVWQIEASEYELNWNSIEEYKVPKRSATPVSRISAFI
tara:strand:+ start:346 stop:786 length:441 start_codon:yes stop_codon:yes gene_type:complete